MTAKKCNNPFCPRVVSLGVQYCCTPCEWSFEDGYLAHSAGPLGHTRECNLRDKERPCADPVCVFPGHDLIISSK